MSRCVARYERRNPDAHGPPQCREEMEVSLEDTHTSLNKCLRRQRRREGIHLDDLPGKITQMKEKVKNFVGQPCSLLYHRYSNLRNLTLT